MNTGWRDEDCDLSLLIPRFRDSSAAASLSDITFNLADGSTVRAHKFILAAASPYFEAKFCGPLAGDSNKVIINNNEVVEVKDVESGVFRTVIDFIYNSGQEYDDGTVDYWALLEAAHMYLLPQLVEYCNEELAEMMKSLDDEGLNAHLIRACKLSIAAGVFKAAIGSGVIREKIQQIMKLKVWLTFDEDLVHKLLQDLALNATEGQLFNGVVKWCQANNNSEEESIKMFQEKFENKIMVKNISHSEFIKTFGKSKYFSFDMYKNMAVDVVKSKVEKLTRFELERRRVKNTIKFVPSTSANVPERLKNSPILLVLDPETSKERVFAKLSEATNVDVSDLKLWSDGDENDDIEQRWHYAGYLIRSWHINNNLESLLEACGSKAVKNREFRFSVKEY